MNGGSTKGRGTGEALRLSGGLAAGALLAAAPAAQAETFVVNSAADPGDSTCDASCTLRDALVAAADNNNPSELDRIVFASSVTGSISPNGPLHQIDEPLSIEGPGARRLSISGGSQHRLFVIGTAEGAEVTLSGLTLEDAAATGVGAAVYSKYADLTLDRVTIVDSQAGGSGGGVYSSSGALTIKRSTIARNRAVADANQISGGGVFVTDGDLTVRGSTIHDNLVSTIDGVAAGGGLYAATSATADVESSTISGNRAVATSGAGQAGGGGIFASPKYSAGNSLNNTIVADNSVSAVGGTGHDVLGAFYTSFTLLERRDSGAKIKTTAAGSNVIGADPRLAPLSLNGGPTPTQALPLSSPAVDRGRSFGARGDQRGRKRPFQISYVPDSKAAGADGADMGAFELAAPVIRCRGAKATRLAGPGVTRGTNRRDVIVGSRGRNVIRALGGNDRVCGLGGPDRIFGGGGRDILDGGAGPDLLRGGGGPDRLFGGPGRDRLAGGPGRDRQRQ